MQKTTHRILRLLVPAFVTFAIVASCHSPVRQAPPTQSPPGNSNRSIERMLENSAGVLDVNASLLVAYVDQIERHRIKQLSLVDADQAALECLPRLKGLETLRFEYGPKTHPQWTDFAPVGRVKTLKSLIFQPQSDSDLVAVGKLKQLKRLELTKCYELSDLGPLAELTQLTTLTIRLFKGDSLDPLAQLKNLTDLKLQSCAEIHDLSPLAGLKTLKSIELGCPRISDLRPLRELQGLTSVSFSGYAPDLSPLASTPIKVLRLDLGPSAEVQGLDRLEGLTSIELRGPAKFDLLAALPNLKSVEVRNVLPTGTLQMFAVCQSLENLDIGVFVETDLVPLSTLANLRELSLPLVKPDVSDLSPLAKLANLSELTLGWRHSLDDMQQLGRLTNLTSLKITATKSPNLDGLAALKSVRSLDLMCAGIHSLEPLADLAQLETLQLRVYRSQELASLRPLRELRNLKSLKLNLLKSTLENLAPLGEVNALENLGILDSSNLKDLSHLAGLTRLKGIGLASCDALTDLEPLGRIASLEQVSLTECPGIQDVSPLSRIGALKSLDLSRCPNIQNLATLGGLTNLEGFSLPPSVTDEELRALCQGGALNSRMTSLTLANCKNLHDLGPLASMTGLEQLVLEGCNAIDLSPIADLGLRKLVLRNCPAPQPPESQDRPAPRLDLTPLARLQSLEELEIAGCDPSVDLTPLAELNGLRVVYWTFHEGKVEQVLPLTKMQSLHYLDLEGASRISEGDVARLRREMPTTRVSGTEYVE